MLVFYFVFGVLLKRGDENFLVFLLVGLIPWMWFSKTVTSCGNSMISGAGLMHQVGVSPIVFPFISILQTSLKQIPVFAVFILMLMVMGYWPSWLWLALIPIIFMQLLLTVFVGGILSAVVPFFRDLTNLIPSVLIFAMFLSGVFFSYEDISSEWQSYFLMNPAAFLLKSYRDVLMYQVYPDFGILFLWIGILVVASVSMLFMLKKLRYSITRAVL
jgi:lipopolysaccharide transport system permease protein